MDKNNMEKYLLKSVNILTFFPKSGLKGAGKIHSPLINI